MFRNLIIAAVSTCVGGAGSVIGLDRIHPGTPATPPPTAFVARPQSATAAGASVRLNRSDDGLFRAPVLINGRRATLVVDTGATVTVLTGADAARLGIDQAKSDGTVLRTASGTAPMRWATVKNLRLGERDHADLDVAIVDAGLDHSLLGQDVLSAGTMLRVQGREMEIS